jgi:hypothetical protein
MQNLDKFQLSLNIMSHTQAPVATGNCVLCNRICGKQDISNKSPGIETHPSVRPFT